MSKKRRAGAQKPEAEKQPPEKQPSGKQPPEKRPSEKQPSEKQSSYYDLKTKAIDDLVNADESNSPQVSAAELRKYRAAPRLKLAEWVKLILIKAWFAGAVCFFFFWGLSTYLADMLDLLFVTGFALGVVTDLLTNPVLRFFEKNPGDNSRWMMFPKKGLYTLFLNVPYGFVILFLVYGLYTGINMAAARITGATDTVFLGVEPVLFGVFCLGFDLLLIKVKHILLGVFRRQEKKPGK